MQVKTPQKKISRKCADCGKEITDKQSIQCHECDKWFCEECLIECENCDEKICNSCSHQVITRHGLCTVCYGNLEESERGEEEKPVEDIKGPQSGSMFLVYNAKGLQAGSNYSVYSSEELAIDGAEKLAEIKYSTVQPYREKMKSIHILKMQINDRQNEAKELKENLNYHFKCPTKGCNCIATRKWGTPKCQRCEKNMVEKKALKNC